MAKIKTFSVARIKNLGNYENVRTELTFELNEGESFTEALQESKVLLDESIRFMITSKTETKL